MHNWPVKHAGIPNFERAIGVSCGQPGAIRERDNGSKIFSDIVGLPDHHLRPVQVLFGAKNLQGAVHAAAKQHFPISRVANTSYPHEVSASVFASNQSFVRQLLLDSLELLLDVPQANAAVGRRSHKLVVVDGVKLPIVDGVSVPFGQIEVLDVHVPLDRQQIPGSVFVEESELLIAVDDHQVRSRGIETEIADGVARERLDYAKTVHVLIHAVEVPQTHVVVEPACCHSVPFWLHCDAGDSLRVAV